MGHYNFFSCPHALLTLLKKLLGGGTGWGMAMNGGFGLVLDGTPEASQRAKDMLLWDVLNGVRKVVCAKRVALSNKLVRRSHDAHGAETQTLST